MNQISIADPIYSSVMIGSFIQKGKDQIKCVIAVTLYLRIKKERRNSIIHPTEINCHVEPALPLMRQCL